MYAILKNGSKQYWAEVGDVIKFEKLDGNVGDKVQFDVIMYSDENGVTVGTPVVENMVVTGEITAQDKMKKIIVFKYKAKKNVRKKQGHRQPFTAVKIESIAAR